MPLLDSAVIWPPHLQQMLCRALICTVFALTGSACRAPGPPPGGADTVVIRSTPDPSGFVLTSPDVLEGGALPVEYTCDGLSATLPLIWSKSPAGAARFAVIMHHVSGPGDSHWYYVDYNIPAGVSGLPKNGPGGGTLGGNSVNNLGGYAPPCSKGPGAKRYTYTVYALSKTISIDTPAPQISRDILLAAMQGSVLASAELNVIYTR
jgi:phosphatidylethanolamine-binding protein (PEBP) family uncharacterized protein